MKICAVVPVYNENLEKLAQVLASLKNYVDDIVVVDDGSVCHSDTPFTKGGEESPAYAGLVGSRIRERSFVLTQDDRIHWLVHSLNRGQGAALQTGTDFAVKNGAEIIVHFDSDGQHNPEDIPDLIKPIQEGRADFVFGSRYLKPLYLERERKIPSKSEPAVNNSSSVLTRDPSPRGNQSGVQDKVGEVPFTKKYLLHPLARLVNYLLTGLNLSDAHNGLRAFRAQIADQVYLSQDRMAHATEYLQLVKKNKIRYTEVAVRVNYSQYGQGLKGGVKVVKELLTQRVIKN